jgi:hypothetical protein
MYIQVLPTPCGRFQWSFIGHDSAILVYGTLHDTDHEANDSAKRYRVAFQEMARTIDDYC